MSVLGSLARQVWVQEKLGANHKVWSLVVLVLMRALLLVSVLVTVLVSVIVFVTVLVLVLVDSGEGAVLGLDGFISFHMDLLCFPWLSQCNCVSEMIEPLVSDPNKLRLALPRNLIN